MSYDTEQQVNNQRMEQLFAQMFPGVNLPYEYVYDMLQFLSTTQVNGAVLPKVIRGVNNIMLGTGRGQVIVHVVRETMNVSVRETDDEIKTRK